MRDKLITVPVLPPPHSIHQRLKKAETYFPCLPGIATTLHCKGIDNAKGIIEANFANTPPYYDTFKILKTASFFIHMTNKRIPTSHLVGYTNRIAIPVFLEVRYDHVKSE